MLRLSRLIPISAMILYFLGLNPGKSMAQNTTDSPYNIVDTALIIYRADDRLINGKYYKPKHFFAEGHPYFLTDDWSQSKLYIKGIEYDNVLIKYNIVEDIVILNTVSADRIAKNIIIYNSFIDSLKIGEHFFHNTVSFGSEKSIGIAELIYKGKIRAYYKHKNEFKEEYSLNYQHGKYRKPFKKLYLFDGTNFEIIRTKKAFLNYFGDNKNELNQFLRKNNIRVRKASAHQLATVLQYCEQF